MEGEGKGEEDEWGEGGRGIEREREKIFCILNSSNLWKKMTFEFGYKIIKESKI